MTEIIPAILPLDYDDLLEHIEAVKGYTRFVQIDVTDGVLTSESSWPYNDSDDVFSRILNEEEAMPFWDSVNFEVDLMLERPAKAIDDWISAGADRLIIHRESQGDISEMIAHIREKTGHDKDTPFYTEVGIAFNIETSLKILEDLHETVDFVQCMGIERIGFQGESFDERVLEKISTLKKRYPKLIISVDGGVNFETAAELIEAGANRLVSGSAIFENEDSAGAIHELKEL